MAIREGSQIDTLPVQLYGQTPLAPVNVSADDLGRLYTLSEITGGSMNVVVQGIALTSFNKPNAVTNVPDNTKTTIVSQAFIAGSFENLVIASVSGGDYAKFFLTVNGTDVDVRRTGPDRNLTFDFTGAPLKLQAGDIVDVKVIHYNAGSLVDFEATIYGYSA